MKRIILDLIIKIVKSGFFGENEIKELLKVLVPKDRKEALKEVAIEATPNDMYGHHCPQCSRKVFLQAVKNHYDTYSVLYKCPSCGTVFVRPPGEHRNLMVLIIGEK